MSSPASLKVFICVWVCFCGFFQASSASAVVTVTAKGSSFFEPGRETIARAKAIDDAKRLAIEQAMGTGIESKTVVENFMLVKDQVISRSSGYLRSFTILSENKNDLGIFEVTIRAEVETAAIAADTGRFQKILSWQKNPRVAVIIDGATAMELQAPSRKAADLLADRLRSSGFNVFQDTPQQRESMGLLVSLSLQRNIRESNFRDMQFVMNEISLSARILRPGDSEILATATAVASIPGDKTLSSLDTGARRCIDSIWNELRTKLTRLWEQDLYSFRDLRLVLQPIPSYTEAVALPGVLSEEVSNIAEAKLVTFADHKATYALKYKGWPEHLITELQMSYFSRAHFASSLEEISGNNIVMRVKKSNQKGVK